jgi:hypothetical protein
MNKTKLYYEILKSYVIYIYSKITIPLTVIFSVLLAFYGAMTKVKIRNYYDANNKLDYVNWLLDLKEYVWHRLTKYAHHFSIIFFLVLLAILTFKTYY